MDTFIGVVIISAGVICVVLTVIYFVDKRMRK